MAQKVSFFVALSIERQIRVLAGSLILTSLTLAVSVSEYWLLLSAFVGVNLIQSSFTGFCPAEMLLKRVQQR